MNTIDVALHQGKVMNQLAKHYADLHAVLLEVVQNGIDSGASWICIQANMQNRTFAVYDNGSGASREKITEALQSIGNTLKNTGKYGQFGLGLISPLSVVREFTLISCPISRRNDYMEYHFVTENIMKQSSVSIPGNSITLEYDPDGKTWWRTRVEARGVTKDRRASRIDAKELSNDISLKFGAAIRERNINITIILTGEDGEKVEMDVEAPQFSGRKIDPFEGLLKECGKVIIGLYLSPMGRRGRKGDIVFGTTDNPSRISPKQFVACSQEFLDSQAAKAILSGVFEGQILCEKIILHADRTKFESNDALFAFCEVLEQWYKKVGKKLVDEAEEQASDDRFQRIGTQVMPYAELLLKQSSFEQVAQRINVGTVGSGHAKVPRKLVIGQDEGKSVAVDGRPFEDKDEISKDGGEKDRVPPKKDRPTHSPGTVYGPRGRKRTEVKGNSTGLRFEYLEMEDFRKPFDYEPKTGTLAFNVNYPSWGLCQENDVFLVKYHIAVVNTALSLELFRDATGTVHQDVFKFAIEILGHQVFAIRNGEALSVKR